MKRYGNLFDKICDINNLRLAHKNAKKGKGWYKEVKMIDKDPDKYLHELQAMFLNRTFHTSSYEVFYKTEGKKRRKIYKLPYYPDRVAQWAILQVIEPYIVKTLIADTYSAIPGRGIHKGLKKLQHAMKYDKVECAYCLKIDARHYYQNINHSILKRKYRRLFKDKDVLYLLDEIIDSVNTIDDEDIVEIQLAGEEYEPETGIPIGNYLSQYSGNYYFSEFDHWVKEVQHVKYYFRYMDDVVIFAPTKERLHELIHEIMIYFHDKMKLRVKHNWQIFPSYVRGVDFLGYRVFGDYTLLRKSTCVKMKRKLTRIRKKCERGNQMNYSEWCSINSYRGWTDHCDSFRLCQKYYAPVKPYALRYYKTVVKKNAEERRKTA